MRVFWQARQKSVGCISPHAWKLPLIMAVCILVYTLPLSLAVSVEAHSGPRVGGAPHDEWRRQQPDKINTTTASDTTGTPGGPSDAIVIGIPTIVFGFLGVLILAGVAIWAAWYQGKKKKNETLNNQSDTIGTPGGPSDAIVIGIPTILVSLLGIIVTAVVSIWGVWYTNKKKKGNDPRPPTTPAVPPTISTEPATTPTVPATPPTVPATPPTVPANTLAVPATTPAVPATTPTVPATTPTVPPTSPTVPATTPAVPATAPTVPPTTPTVPATTPAVSSLTLSAIDDCITTYVRYLKSKYRQKKITDDKRCNRKPTSPRYINLTVVRQHNIDKSERGRSTKMRGNIGNILTKKKGSLELKDLDQLEGGSKAKCVLVQGAPGVGKTTMAQELCRQWAKKKLFKHYSLLVLLKLRNKSVQSIKEKKDLFLHSSDPSAVASIVEKYTETETAFLLDGFDELPQEMQMNSVFVDLIKKDIFPDACVIITSRPSVSDILCNHCSEQCYQHIEVLGFTEEQRKGFVKAWFDHDKSVEESSREDEQRQFEEYLDFHPHIRALMYIPLSCSIVLSVYRSSSKARNNAPKTQTELYTCNTLAILSRYLNKRDGKETWKLKKMQDIPDKEQEKFKKLSELAYGGIVKMPQQLIFQEEEIPEDLIEDKEAMGFLDVDDDMFGPDSYNFLHLTIQEFLAAYYISTLEASEQVRPSAEQEQKIEDSIGKRHLEIMLRFYAGLSCIQQGSVASRTLTHWLQTHYDSEPGRRLEYLRWMFEAQNKELLRHTLSNGTQDLNLSGQTLSPFDCYILGYCIANLNEASALRENTGLTELRLEDCHIDAEGISHLEQALHVNTSLRVLNFRWNTVGSQVAEHLASALRGNTSLTELRLRDCRIDAEGLSHLAQALCVNTTLRVLDLSGNTVDSQGAEHLASALRENTGLTELRLYNCRIDAEGTSQLAQALHVNTTLRVLDLSGNTVDSQGAEHLASALSGNTGLTELRLRDCDIGAEGLSHLVQALCDNTTLRVLDLSNNTVDSQGAEHLASVLKGNTVLTELKLRGCHIDAEGIFHLEQALRDNTTLRVLDLSNNTVDSQGAEHLASVLRENTVLTELRLYNCHIEVEGMSHLAPALCVNTTLTVLNLSGNTVVSQGVEHLALVLEKTRSLTELWLEESNIGEDGACWLARAIPANSTLKKLDLIHNPLGERGAKVLVESLALNTTIEELYLPEQYKDTTSNSVVEYDKVSKRVHWW